MEFLNGGPERIRELDEAIARLERTPGDRAAVAELKRQFHRLVGAGGTFGYTGLSELAREGEQLCVRFDPAGPAVSSVAFLRWRALLAQLDAALTNARKDTGSRPCVDGPTHMMPDIVVVDRDPSVHERLSRLLAHEGLGVRLAATAEEADAAFDVRMPDGVVVDIDLPDAPGYAVVEGLRARPGGDVPVVVIVSLDNDFLDQAEAIHAGADACFEKPQDWSAVVRKLHQLLERVTAVAPRILVVEDDPSHAAYARSILEPAGYDVLVCESPRQFTEMLSAYRPDLVLMDIVLPEVLGTDLAKFVRQNDQYVTLPIVFLTSDAELDVRIRTVKAGGDDYLIKPVHPALLVATVAAKLERSRFLKTLLDRDGLTRLLTHTSFMEHAHAVVAQKTRAESGPACLVMIDLDHFKSINDTYGHQGGDRVIVTLAGLLRRHLRRSDVVGRYGGEEFGILLDQVTEADAVRLLIRLSHEFAAAEHRAPSGAAFRATFSAGIAAFDPRTMDLERWIQAADAALYGAKRAGRNRVMTHGEWVAALRPGVPAA